MPQSFVALLAHNPILTLFLAIGLGYIVGEAGIFGFRFGVAGVLFVGLAIGALDRSVALPEVIPTLGLIIFVYTIGIQSGPALASVFRHRGYRDALLTLGVLVFGALLTVALSYSFRIPGPRAAGLFCGALTSTPALAATRETVHDLAVQRALPADRAREEAAQPVASYSISYPLGVIGVILCFQLFGRFWRTASQPVEEAPEILVRDFVVRNPGVAGRTIGDVLRVHKDYGFVVSRIQHDGQIDIATSGARLEFGDVLAVVGDEDALERATQIFGEPSSAHIEFDRSRFDHRRIYVSAKEVVGKRIRDLDLQNRLHATITRLRRGDVDIVPAPDTRLEYGDQIRVLTSRDRVSEIQKFFGDSVRGLSETDFGSVAIGMVLGVLFGMLPIPMPGGNTIRLGLAGGPLLTALALGKIERTGRITWARDTIEPVPKGEYGGDALQHVVGPLGQMCGTILWESKRTRNWAEGWLAKLRDDQRAAKAEISVLVSQALPKEVEAFDIVDGVWVTHPRVAIPVAIMLRHSLIEVATARQASEGQQTKMEILYAYLTGPRFRQRVQAIVEAFSNMKEDLDKEKKAITKQWAKRDEQIERVMQATVGMYGDMQGIAGKTLQEIEGLEMKALEDTRTQKA